MPRGRKGRDDNVLSCADHEDALLDEGIAESGIVHGCGDALFPLSDAGQFGARVFRERDVDEGNVHVGVAVFRVCLLEAGGGFAEPLDLVLLKPVVAGVFVLIRRVCVRVHEVHCHGGVLAAAGQNLDVVVSYAVDVSRPGAREGEGQRFHEGHLAGTRHGLFIVVVAEYAGVGNLALD